ncbi:MAG: hypothetical protein Q4G14_06770 [Paracoccus sp. (in: a-proteobacteria)]|uniref:NrdR family transcriptional regulator n=1 Tax=Paracoccus sp. TaxID=267 RepID=UPI0026DF9E07|nr:hypothetical protein [Paracoccus sp. (in: a-proteobacteria)]MDO5612930.1 hypothetical protein [Paracoccus sp. (in: a-proteobacteria)]
MENCGLPFLWIIAFRLCELFPFRGRGIPKPEVIAIFNIRKHPPPSGYGSFAPAPKMSLSYRKGNVMAGCAKCGGKTRVYGSINEGVFIRRYRRCTVCGQRFKTYEELGEVEGVRPYSRQPAATL